MRNAAIGSAAGITLGAMLGLMVILHSLILARVVPARIVWGGQLGDSSTRLVVMEVVAIVVILVFIATVVFRTRDLGVPDPRGWPRVGMWVIVGYLILNTLGNLASGIRAESLIFAPLTVFMALCAFRLALK